ncbi:MAG: hypothetical protein QT10_C0007G0026 [archaeon GW2011_AR19]|nr:MAG: hypothetical protein QT10_C0007G0026 [archaeon GW2011_AR19]
MEKIKNPVIIEGLLLLFSWIVGLIIDDTIQKSIVQYPDSYKLYQLIQNITHADNFLASLFVFLWVLGTIIYILHKVKD